MIAEGISLANFLAQPLKSLKKTSNSQHAAFIAWLSHASGTPWEKRQQEYPSHMYITSSPALLLIQPQQKSILVPWWTNTPISLAKK